MQYSFLSMSITLVKYHEFLDLPRKTFTYRKNKIQNICKKLLKIFATLMISFHVFKERKNQGGKEK